MLKALMNIGSKNYLRSNKIILPLIGYFAYFGIAYSVGPQKVIPSLVVQAIFMFFLMIIIAVTYCDAEHEVLQQILILKAGPKNKPFVYISKILVLSKILAILSVISTIYPFVRYYFGFSGLFDRGPNVSDALLGLIVIFEFGFLGLLIGVLINQSWIPSRKLQLCIIVLVAIVAVVENRIVEDIKVLRYLTWILPPLSVISKQINLKEYASINAFWALGQGLIYCVIYIVLYLLIMSNTGKRSSSIRVNKKDKKL